MNLKHLITLLIVCNAQTSLQRSINSINYDDSEERSNINFNISSNNIFPTLKVSTNLSDLIHLRKGSNFSRPQSDLMKINSRKMLKAKLYTTPTPFNYDNSERNSNTNVNISSYNIFLTPKTLTNLSDFIRLLNRSNFRRHQDDMMEIDSWKILTIQSKPDTTLTSSDLHFSIRVAKLFCFFVILVVGLVCKTDKIKAALGNYKSNNVPKSRTLGLENPPHYILVR